MVSVAIVTRNAVHGGVETMVAAHQKFFDATVFVAGGVNNPDTCPFRYTYVDGSNRARARARLARALRRYDVIIYHWLPTWAQESVQLADRPCIEVVHRTDTADNDKNIPDVLVTHSQFLANFLRQEYAREAVVIPHFIDVERFPANPSGLCVGAITSYYANKGIDLLIEAWARIEGRFPQHRLRLYGAGTDLSMFKDKVRQMGLTHVDLLGPTPNPESQYAEFCLFVQPSRSDGMPFAIMEALACNIPVLASDLPAMVEFNNQAETRGRCAPLTLFRSEDVSDLTEQMTNLLQERVGQSQNNREYIQQFYGLDQHYQLYVKAIRQAIVSHKARIVEERTWDGIQKPPAQIMHNVYRVVVPRQLRIAYWLRRNRP